MARTDRRTSFGAGSARASRFDDTLGRHDDAREAPFEGQERTGQVARVVREKGFGFITLVGGTEVFYHRSGFVDPSGYDQTKVGDYVRCKVTQGPKGLRAFDVQGIDQ